MNKMDKLKKEGRKIATLNGHTLKNFATSRHNKNVATAICNNCGRGVTVNIKPAKNDRLGYTSGSALTIGCDRLFRGRK